MALPAFFVAKKALLIILAALARFLLYLVDLFPTFFADALLDAFRRNKWLHLVCLILTTALGVLSIVLFVWWKNP